MEVEEVSAERKDSLEGLSYIVVGVFVFLLPFFVVPTALVSLEISKATLFLIGVSLATILWLLSILRKGVVVLPRTPIIIAALLPAAIYLVASFFAEAPMAAIFGQGFLTDTFAFVFAGGLTTILVASIATSSGRTRRLYWAFAGGAAVLLVAELVHLVGGPGLIPLGLFTNPISNLLGKWNDVGVFFGLTLLLSLITIETVQPSRWKKVLAYTALVLSLFMLVFVQFMTAWYMVAVFSFIFFILRISAQRTGSTRRRFSVFTGIVLAISIVAILTAGSLNNTIAGVFNTSQVEVRPSWSATFGVARDVLEDSPLIGSGPNHFAEQWFLHKPEGINTTAFWAVPFQSGIGFIPTSFVTTGVLGFAMWALFIGLLLVGGIRSVLYSGGDERGRHLMTMSLIAALYLWVFSVVYVSNTVVMALAFFFSGLFVASAVRIGVIRTRTISFANQPTQNFSITLISVAAIIFIGIGGYVAGSRFVSVIFYQRGIQIAQSGGTLQEAEQSLTKAIQLSEQDRYYRALADVQAQRLSGVLSQPGVSADVLRGQFQTILGSAIANAQRATEVGAHNFENWLLLGSIYEQLSRLRIDGAYENAAAAYARAKEKNPSGPNIPLVFARLEATRGDFDAARVRIDEALALKPNYTDAVYLLSQIEVSDGNISKAIKSVETAALLAPNDPVVFFQLGLLRYSNGQFSDAAGAFENAVLLNPIYANAKYFLGLSYEKIGRQENAISQFEDVALLNPDNKEVVFILNNLQAGRDPFDNVEPPLDDQPESREELPVEEPVVDES